MKQFTKYPGGYKLPEHLQWYKVWYQPLPEDECDTECSEIIDATSPDDAARIFNLENPGRKIIDIEEWEE